jgi:uncharacterized protein YndB with AHSA1/START domain
MKTLNFDIVIDAKREIVWNTMLAPDSYKSWTSAFFDGSYYEGSWEKGERIRFMDPNGSGMVAVITENRPYEYISIKHIGYINGGVEDFDSDEVRSWAPVFENYSFSDVGETTRLEVSLEIAPVFEEQMVNDWPIALAKLKELCEAASG